MQLGSHGLAIANVAVAAATAAAPAAIGMPASSTANMAAAAAAATAGGATDSAPVVGGNSGGGLSCPVCPAPMAYADVERHASPADFALYDERLARAALEADPLFRWCPRGACGAGQLLPEALAVDAAAVGGGLRLPQPRVVCLYCRGEFCAEHRVPWHEGLTCAQYDELGAELAAADRAAAEEEEEQELAAGTELSSGASDTATGHGGALLGLLFQGSRAATKAPEAKEQAPAFAERRERHRQLAYERFSEAYVRRTMKACPGCGWWTELFDGCKRIYCKFRRPEEDFGAQGMMVNGEAREKIPLLGRLGLWRAADFLPNEFREILGIKCGTGWCYKCGILWDPVHYVVAC